MQDLEMNGNKTAPFGKEATAKELQDDVAMTQDSRMDVVEDAEWPGAQSMQLPKKTVLAAAPWRMSTCMRSSTLAILCKMRGHFRRHFREPVQIHEHISRFQPASADALLAEEMREEQRPEEPRAVDEDLATRNSVIN